MLFSNSIEEHEVILRKVLDRLAAAGLYCSPKKTDLAVSSTDFLGHGISLDGLSADDSKIAKIRNWPRPRTAKQLRGFLGLVQYLRKLIDNLASLLIVCPKRFTSFEEDRTSRATSTLANFRFSGIQVRWMPLPLQVTRHSESKRPSKHFQTWNIT